ncbi:hypothetical protein LCGC14_0959450 [marine sediment metagenome]|uniref:Uncharacterized protein n=1 Tax=marine sediment metagenome TaxID=412755 RepID=A0A0F9P109_9ZZZZ
MNQITLQQLRNILIGGKFPSETVKVKGISFEFTFTDDDISLCSTVIDCVEFLSKVVKCAVFDSIVQLTDLPSVYFYPLQTAYFEFQRTTLCALLEAVVEFVKSNESRGLWLIYKHSDSSHVLSINNGKLHLIQQRWVALNAMNDTKDNMTMITDIFEAAKPWFDKELYAKIKEHTDSMRENAFFDSDSYDDQLREKARNVVAQQKIDTETEGDIIIIEEEKG